MGGYEIRAQFEAACDRSEVAKWLATPEGIAGWWSDKVEGVASREGDRFSVFFPTSPVAFELVVTATSDNALEWHIPESPPWWKGTTIRFDLSENADGKTVILFRHQGFDPDDPIIQAITPAWVRFLDNLVRVSESGVANPAVRN